MHKLPNLLKSRHGVYYIRQYRDGKEVRQSLLTKDFKTAKLLALRYLISKAMSSRKYEIDLGRGIFKAEGQEDHEAMIKTLDFIVPKWKMDQYIAEAHQSANVPEGTVKPAPPAPQPKLQTKLFSVATELYLAEKKLSNSQKTIDEKRSTYKEFIRLFGDVDTNSIGSEPAISYKNRLIAENYSSTRINKVLSFMRDFFNYATDHKLYFDSNPFENLSVAKASRSVESYEEFTDEELVNIFENNRYKSYLNKPDYFWLPFVALFTGARIESLACLRVQDIRVENGVWIFNIWKDKNTNSIRKVPIHKTILESGFLKYVESVKGKNGQIFPHLKPGKNGFSKNCSRRFNDYLRLIGVKQSKTKSFHSFRSTFINRMTYLNIHPAILMGIVGHYEQAKIDFSSPHFTSYQKQKPMEVLKSAIDQLEYKLKLDF